MKPKVNAALRHLVVPIGKLRPDPENARTHDERNIEAIQASLAEHGQQRAVVATKDGTVIAGNGTLAAARRLGWTGLAVLRWDGTKEKASAYGIADNRTGELSAWDTDVLAAELQALNAEGDDALRTLGFSDEEFMRIVNRAEGGDRPHDVGDAVPPPAGEDGRPKAPPGNIRTVQLFLNDKTKRQFDEWERKLRKKYRTKALTDTVVEAVARIAKKVRG